VRNDFIILKSNQGEQSITIRPQFVYDICFLRLTECLFVYCTNCVNILGNFFSDFNMFHLAEYSFS
jgi:hypothetical protein